MKSAERAGHARRLAHLCVDMQRIFADDTPWHAPWIRRILPAIEEIAGALSSSTVFTRFIPPQNIDAAPGRWKNYYALWPEMVADRLSPDLLDLVSPLKRFTPPGRLFDKPVYSPWWSGQLHRTLQARGANTLVITGGETDVCVLATVLGAIDLGYHVYLPLDALYGSADATHDAMLKIYRSRFQAQLTITTVDEFSLICREYNL
jgi:nicotinamidase-related amidase